MKTARPTHPPATGRQAGYNMVILIIALTVLNIMLAVALPQWSHLIQRDKEEELRSRGLQYAEAIRIFQMRYGRLPVRLEELIEVKPRSIRRLWADPMTDGGKWGIIFQQMGQPQPGQPGEPEPPPDPQGRNLVPPSTFSVPGSAGLVGPGGKQITIGPIVGVHSLSEDAAIGSFFGATAYNQWLFRVDLLQRSLGRPEVQAQLPRLDLRNLGRPFRPGLEVSALPGDALGATVGRGLGPGAAGGVGGGRGQGGFQPGQRRPAGFQPGGQVPGRRPTTGFPRPPSRPRPPNVRPGSPGGRPTGTVFPGGPAPPGGVFPGAPGAPPANPGFPGGSGPGGSGPSGSGPGGTPPGGGPGFDPTVPQNVSPSTFLPAPSSP